MQAHHLLPACTTRQLPNGDRLLVSGDAGPGPATKKQTGRTCMSILRFAAAAALALAAAGTAAAAPVRIGIAAEPYPPFFVADASGQWTGWEIDIANVICAKMNAGCTDGERDVCAIVDYHRHAYRAYQLRRKPREITRRNVFQSKLDACRTAMRGRCCALDESSLSVSNIIRDGDETNNRHVHYRRI